MKSYAETQNALDEATPGELEKLIEVCLGRVLRMGARPARPGDGEEFDRCAGLAKEAASRLGIIPSLY